jgi:hypothetical protein
MERSTNLRKVTSLRRELENYVIAWNNLLKDVVVEMDYIILLRNANPTFRSDYAYRLLREGLITKEEAKEFVKLA